MTRAMGKGCEMAYRAFHEAYFDRLLRYLLVVTRGDEEAAREALQLTLLRVVRHIKPFRAEATFWSWLTVLARSAASDESRKRRRYFAFLDRFTRQAEVDATEGNADDTLREMLNRNMKLLAADDQDLMDRKYSAGESVRDIALSLDMTEKAVESRLARIRQKLREAVLADLEE